MRLSLRLLEILRNDLQPRRGIIKHICDETGLERHQVSDLLHNRTQYISMSVLGRLCNYLVEHHGIDPQLLPGLLFSRDPEEFWQLLALRERLEICLGVRQIEEGEHFFVIASDAKLQGEVLHGISGSGNPEERGHAGKMPVLSPRQFLKFRHVLAPSRPPYPLDLPTHQRQAEEVYSRFAAHKGNRALVCLGSIKVNPVVENVLAHAFGAKPFQSEEDVSRARDRQVPFMFRFRTEDPKPISCCGGIRLSASEPADQPGIYFEKPNGKWECAPCNGDRDVALVFYIYSKTQDRLEMVLGGYSAWATEWLANRLRISTAEFWPPTYDTSELMVGAFLVNFTFSPSRKEPGIGHKHLPSDTEVIRLDAKVIARRLDRSS